MINAISVLFAVFGGMCLIFSGYLLIRLLYLYYHYREQALATCDLMQHAIDSYCSENGVKSVKINLVKWWEWAYIEQIAYFDIRLNEIYITPTLSRLLLSYCDLGFTRWRILYSAGHELCHYLQKLENRLVKEHRKQIEVEAISWGIQFADKFYQGSNSGVNILPTSLILIDDYKVELSKTMSKYCYGCQDEL